MVIEKVSYSWWEHLRRIIAFFLCPELKNLEDKYMWMQEYSSWIYFKWYKDVKGKEKGISKLNKRIKNYEKEIKKFETKSKV